MSEFNENVIEWLTGEDTISVTVSQKKWVNKIKRFAETDENVEIFGENSDGSIFAHLPLNYLKLSPKRRDNITAERKAELVEQLRKMREAKNT